MYSSPVHTTDDTNFLRSLDNTYLELLNSLVKTLIERIIKFYKN